MKPHRIIARAYIDLVEAEDRLEREHPGYGREFGNLFEFAVRVATDSPQRYSLAFDSPNRKYEIREYHIARFEYRLIYALLPTEIVFLALVHARSKPGSWTGRLKAFKEQS